jgi:hypothetical protein
MRNLTNLISLSLCLSFVACEDLGFEEFGEVSKLRVLAIRVDPPEIGPGETAVIDALIVNPEGGVVSYLWEVCAFTEGPDEYYRCAEEGGEVLGAALGTTSEVALPYDVVEAVLGDIDAICDSLAELDLGDFAGLPDCERGFPVTIRLTTSTGGAVGDNIEIATAGLLLLNEEAAALGTANRRPLLDGVLFDNRSSPAEPIAVVLDGEEGAELQALVEPETAAETFDDIQDDGSTVEDRERLQLTWFSTIGTIERTRTFFSEENVTAAELQSNLFDLTRGTTQGVVGDAGTVYLVLRDNRGGLDFLAQEFVIVSGE